MKKYKLWIRKYSIFKNDYEVIEKVITTNDIYHEIGYIYCTTLEKIERIDYHEVKEQKIYYCLSAHSGTPKNDSRTLPL